MNLTDGIWQAMSSLTYGAYATRPEVERELASWPDAPASDEQVVDDKLEDETRSRVLKLIEGLPGNKRMAQAAFIFAKELILAERTMMPKGNTFTREEIEKAVCKAWIAKGRTDLATFVADLRKCLTTSPTPTKPDPAVEAVFSILRASDFRVVGCDEKGFVMDVVAAVRKADKEKSQ